MYTETGERTKPKAGLRYQVAIRSHRGHVRERNEDAAGAVPLPDGGWVVAVADGMGSHRAGDVASRLAVDTVMDGLLEVALPKETEARLERLVELFHQAHDRIEAEGEREEDWYRMGATLLVAVFGRAGVTVQYAGDTRLYWVREGTVLRRTRDQTAAQVLVELGRIQEEELEDHPMAAKLLSNIGGGVVWEGIEVAPGPAEEATFQPRPGDVVLICTDGVWGELRWELVPLVSQAGSAEERAERVLEAVLATRARDNATLVVVNVMGGEEPSAEGEGA